MHWFIKPRRKAGGGEGGGLSIIVCHEYMLVCLMFVNVTFARKRCPINDVIV